jgi:hypothetical protein
VILPQLTRELIIGLYFLEFRNLVGLALTYLILKIKLVKPSGIGDVGVRFVFGLLYFGLVSGNLRFSLRESEFWVREGF